MSIFREPGSGNVPRGHKVAMQKHFILGLGLMQFRLCCFAKDGSKEQYQKTPCSMCTISSTRACDSHDATSQASTLERASASPLSTPSSIIGT